MSKDELDQAIKENLNLFLELTGRDDIDPLTYYHHRAGVTSSLNVISQVLSAITSNPAAYMEQLFAQTWNLNAILVWLTPSALKADYPSVAVDFPNAEASIVAMRNEFLNSVGKIKASVSDVTAVQVEMTRIAEIIKGQERESGNAKINTDANASFVAAQKQDIEN